MSFFKKLFGGGDKAAAAGPTSEPVEYKGFNMNPAPMAEAGGQHRLAGTITKEVGGELKTHKLIRADVFSDRDVAIEAFIRKSKQVIDESGDRLF